MHLEKLESQAEQMETALKVYIGLHIHDYPY